MATMIIAKKTPGIMMIHFFKFVSLGPNPKEKTNPIHQQLTFDQRVGFGNSRVNLP